MEVIAARQTIEPLLTLRAGFDMGDALSFVGPVELFIQEALEFLVAGT